MTEENNKNETNFLLLLIFCIVTMALFLFGMCIGVSIIELSRLHTITDGLSRNIAELIVQSTLLILFVIAVVYTILYVKRNALQTDVARLNRWLALILGAANITVGLLAFLSYLADTKEAHNLLGYTARTLVILMGGGFIYLSTKIKVSDKKEDNASFQELISIASIITILILILLFNTLDEML